MRRHYLLILLTSIIASSLFSEELRVVFYAGNVVTAIPVENIDSISLPSLSSSMLVFFPGKDSLQLDALDSIKIADSEDDTLRLVFSENVVSIYNPLAPTTDVRVSEADVDVFSHRERPIVIKAEGKSVDGRIRIIADTTFTICLNELSLSSRHAPAINSSSKQRMKIELADGTTNYLQDGKEYIFNDTLEKSNACLCSQGHIDFCGNGTLVIHGNQKHGIAADRGIRLMEGNISILSAPADGINSDKYISLEGAQLNISGQKQDGIDASGDVNMLGGLATITVSGDTYKGIKSGASFSLSDGELHLLIEGKASKGIKTKGAINIEGGILDAVATGDVLIENGDPSYCSILKSDSVFYMSDGEIHLVNMGQGGKCISVDRSMTITGGDLYLETNGDGAEYLNSDSLTDYYTPKCISADDSIRIVGGQLDCISTGLGGKGIVSGKYLSIGSLQSSEEPIVSVETKGTCIFDDVDEDKRYGCPKGIKVGNQVEVFSGNINVKTFGQGGEGIECKSLIRLHNAQIQCITYEDGINVGQHLVIDGARIYCFSLGNDGIDSNGKITMKNGIVVSISKHEQDESFDSDLGRFYIYGGIVFGIGRDWAKVREAEQPYYTTKVTDAINTPISLHALRYLTLMDGEKCLYSVSIPCDMENAYVTLSMPSLKDNYLYKLAETDDVYNVLDIFFDGKLKVDGHSDNYITLKEILTIISN